VGAAAHLLGRGHSPSARWRAARPALNLAALLAFSAVLFMLSVFILAPAE
jgi:hypothetical protein